MNSPPPTAPGGRASPPRARRRRNIIKNGGSGIENHLQRRKNTIGKGEGEGLFITKLDIERFESKISVLLVIFFSRESVMAEKGETIIVSQFEIKEIQYVP